MTPEDRAQLIMAVDDVMGMHPDELATEIADAIRAAENDALERAEMVARDLTDPLGLGDRIRALKHKETV